MFFGFFSNYSFTTVRNNTNHAAITAVMYIILSIPIILCNRSPECFILADRDSSLSCPWHLFTFLLFGTGTLRFLTWAPPYQRHTFTQGFTHSLWLSCLVTRDKTAFFVRLNNILLLCTKLSLSIRVSIRGYLGSFVLLFTREH